MSVLEGIESLNFRKYHETNPKKTNKAKSPYKIVKKHKLNNVAKNKLLVHMLIVLAIHL